MIPDNVQIRKPRQPKTWCYVFTTTEILEGLAPKNLFHIQYSNSIPPARDTLGRENKAFPVFDIKWYGTQVEPFFLMTVHVCKPQVRKNLLEIVKKDVFPKVKIWLDQSKTKKVPMISLDYRTYPVENLSLITYVDSRSLSDYRAGIAEVIAQVDLHKD